jgi:hypothetical protein
MGRVARRLSVVLLTGVCAIAGALGFGMTPSDARRVRAFGEAVRSWQHDPDYRAVAAQYVTLGVDAMQSRLCCFSAGTLIMAFRSLPGLPDHLAVSDTSAAHYKAFSEGDLSAYLHLSSEQGVADGIAMVERLGRSKELSDADIVAFLAGFKLPVPTATDAGAVAGVRRLLADVDVSHEPFLVRGDVSTSLLSGVEGNISTMTRAEQAAEFAQFDAHVRAADPELWRSKQVSDFLAGIWAQGYGQIYLDGINGFFRIQYVARIVFIIGVLMGMALIVRRRLRPTSAAPSADVRPESLAARTRG